MSYDGTHVAQLNHLKSLASNIKNRLDDSIKFVSVSANSISFFKSSDGSGTAAYTVDFPTEFLLDQTKTTFASSFAWSSTTYPGSTNPSLDGKPVLVLAVKGNDASVAYSFLNMASLIDTYTVATGNSAKLLSISGRTITFKVSAAANQAITVQNDGLHVNISTKADKVSSATNDNLAALDANGNLKDSGLAKSTVTGYATTIATKATKVSSATANNFAMLTSAGDIADSGVSKSTVTGYATTIAGKIDKVTSATANRVAAFVSGGGLKDCGILYTALLTTSNLATDAEMTEVINEVFGS